MTRNNLTGKRCENVLPSLSNATMGAVELGQRVIEAAREQISAAHCVVRPGVLAVWPDFRQCRSFFSPLAPQAQQQRDGIMPRPHEALHDVYKRGQNGADRAG